MANRFIDTITERFFTLACFPYIGRSREEDFGPGYRSLAAGEYVIVYCIENEDALILRVVHGRRQLELVAKRVAATLRRQGWDETAGLMAM
jgi:toxin ParE1/3/4